jgi:hypothetical protein
MPTERQPHQRDHAMHLPWRGSGTKSQLGDPSRQASLVYCASMSHKATRVMAKVSPSNMRTHGSLLATILSDVAAALMLACEYLHAKGYLPCWLQCM